MLFEEIGKASAELNDSNDQEPSLSEQDIDLRRLQETEKNEVLESLGLFEDASAKQQTPGTFNGAKMSHHMPTSLGAAMFLD